MSMAWLQIETDGLFPLYFCRRHFIRAIIHVIREVKRVLKLKILFSIPAACITLGLVSVVSLGSLRPKKSFLVIFSCFFRIYVNL